MDSWQDGWNYEKVLINYFRKKECGVYIKYQKGESQMKIAGIVLVIFGGALIIYLNYLGLFSKVSVSERQIDSFLMVYQKHIGEYKEVGAIMDKMYYDLKDNYKIETTKGFGVYYDNPQKVAKEKCRSISGCVLEYKDAARVEELKKKYMVIEYPKSNSVVAEFPFKSKMSIIVGIMKVYPKLMVYIEKKEHKLVPFLELYDMSAKKTVYAMSTDLESSIFNTFLDPSLVEVKEEVADSIITDSVNNADSN